jgi:hypothetical protein
VLTLIAEPGAAVFLQHESRPLLERVNIYAGGTPIVRLKFVQASLANRLKSLIRPCRAGHVAPDDPAQSFKGPDALRQALLGLAGWRRRPD